MTEKLTVPMTSGTMPWVPPWARNVFWGGVVGLAVGVAVAFALAIVDGFARGMSPLACAAYGCTLTMLLSHPAGIGGMLLGAVLGAFGGSCYRALRPDRSASA
jgi:hypothetical protein